ncbi:hypothetical protein vBAbaPP1_154 [Acinetobacter phage vB_AbaM_P1]|nr:hypothetical protein vBAbaPP1_154 [Acinetobacter phage vB_AbaM_P1]
MGDKPSDIFRLEERCIGFPRKHQDAFKSSLKAMNDSVAIREEIQRSQMAMSEYMNMTKFIEEPEDQGDDDDWDCDDTAIEEFTASVVGQGHNITAIANAVTTLNCKADAMAINDLHQKVGDGPVHVDHSRFYKAMDVESPYTMVMDGSVHTINDRYVQIDRVFDFQVPQIIRAFDQYTSIGLDGYSSRVPYFYYYLGKTFIVWDEGRNSILDIFRSLYRLRNIGDFKRFCDATGHTVVYDSLGDVVGVALHDESRSTGRILHPKRVSGNAHIVEDFEFNKPNPYDEDKHRYRIGLTKGTTRRDRVSDDLDTSYAEAMKARRDGKTWDERTLSCGQRIRVSSEPSQTMTEEIEQRLIDKYLT